jgi:hypothetical protein
LLGRLGEETVEKVCVNGGPAWCQNSLEMSPS